MEEAAAIMRAGTLYTFRRILLPAVLPAAAAVAALNFNNLLDDYDTAVLLAHPLYQPLGLQIKANTDGGASVESIGNTFVYTVLLRVVMGTVMYLVYGQLNRVRRSPRARRVPLQRVGGDAGTPNADLPEASAMEDPSEARVP
ncbi:Binding-protein-dependent transport system inner membrane component [Arthrobacter subterraneus]|uniref:Binding-protein-dependent transport system inner membrane component n=1 Tax=Arthrobacter subterraneus TaxID=335973 RepID=A0A1G8PXF3_9MICC|nr:Binding-protein-dependent transport system inner membrane component [Arthrobacter subterraneus]